MVLDKLKEAIAARKPISFTYDKPGKTPGERIGNTYAVFIMRKKDGSESTKVHIEQVDGVTDSEKPLPSFRMFDLSELDDVEVMHAEAEFEISDQYNPESPMYEFVIAKV